MTRSSRHSAWRRRAHLAAGLLTAAAVGVGCEQTGAGAYAKRVQSPNELIGGPGAIGAVGDWLIGNQKIHVIIQDEGWSRGFGIFGGGIIDADLVRPGAVGTPAGGKGMDNYGEFFPALFLQAFDVADQNVPQPSEQCTQDSDCAAGETCNRSLRLCSRQVPGIEVLRDGSDGGDAVIRTHAKGGDFLYMVSNLVNLALPSRGLEFETDYVVHPGARHVDIIGRIKNVGTQPLSLDGGALGDLLKSQFGVSQLQLPLGDVALFGAGNKVFAPGAVKRPDRPARPVGFDLRYSVEDAYKVPRSLPALPGLVVPFLATSGPGVSYGYAAADSPRNYVWLNKDQYERDPEVHANQHDLLVPFLIQSFTGAYQEVPPATLEPGQTFSYKRYFIIGKGDVASIRDELYRIRGTPTGIFSGRIINSLTGKPETEAQVQLFDDQQRSYSEIQTDADGRFKCDLAAGSYYYVITAPGRYPYSPGPTRFSDANHFTLKVPGGVYRFIQLPPPAHLAVQVVDKAGRPLPSKVSVVGHYQVPDACQSCTALNCDDVCSPRRYLFEFPLGERRRHTNLNWRRPPGSRDGDFIEKQLWPGADGYAEDVVRPSRCNEQRCAYDIYVSRGDEYDLSVTHNVFLQPGKRTNLSVVLHRVVDTTNYVSADFHVHSINSVDSFLNLQDRVRAAGAEGLEIAVSTDHNFVTDYRPAIKALGLQDWVATIRGVELTTLEMGHFNGFPLAYTPGAPTHFPFVDFCFRQRDDPANGTAFDWVQCKPQTLFDNLRALGEYGPSKTIVEVNHPRDTIMGYFNQFYLNPYTAKAETPTNDNYPLSDFPFYLRPRNQTTHQYEAKNFSYDFDALEVLNGKRQDLLHAFKLPMDVPADILGTDRDVCGSGHPANGPGKVLLRHGGYPAYPGGVDDWMHLLNNGYKITATGNSDSHTLHAEIGNPRNFLWVEPAPDGTRRDDHPGAIPRLDIVDALQKHRSFLTNGPFLTLSVHTLAADNPNQVVVWPMGSTVLYSASNAGQPVDIFVHFQTAPWVDVERVLLYANGKVIDTKYPKPDAIHEDTIHFTETFDRDTWVAAEAYGNNNLFPVETPKEEPPTNIGDALAGLTGSLGVGVAFGSYDGFHGPSYIQKVTPYALTNPIWLDIDANGHFNPPGNTDLGPGPAPSQPTGSCSASEPCPGTQVCDLAAGGVCRCPSSQPVLDSSAKAAAVGPMIFAAPHGPHHYGVGDIRRIFNSVQPR